METHLANFEITDIGLPVLQINSNCHSPFAKVPFCGDEIPSKIGTTRSTLIENEWGIYPNDIVISAPFIFYYFRFVPKI